MGDAVNTPWDVLLYFLVFGGVPTLIAVYQDKSGKRRRLCRFHQ